MEVSKRNVNAMQLLSSFVRQESDEKDDSQVSSSSKDGGQHQVSRPRNRRAFLARVHSYNPLRWFAKPTWLSPLECSRYGWENIDVDILRCVSCKIYISGRMPASHNPKAYGECCAQLKQSLHSGHRLACPWSSSPSPEYFLFLPQDTRTKAIHTFNESLKRLSRLCGNLPLVPESTLNTMCLDLSQLQQVLSMSSHLGKGASSAEVQSAALLALTGWTTSFNSAGNTSMVHCSICNRDIGMWNFLTLANPVAQVSKDEIREICQMETDINAQQGNEAVKTLSQKLVISKEEGLEPSTQNTADEPEYFTQISSIGPGPSNLMSTAETKPSAESCTEELEPPTQTTNDGLEPTTQITTEEQKLITETFTEDQEPAAQISTEDQKQPSTEDQVSVTQISSEEQKPVTQATTEEKPAIPAIVNGLNPSTEASTDDLEPSLQTSAEELVPLTPVLTEGLQPSQVSVRQKVLSTEASTEEPGPSTEVITEALTSEQAPITVKGQDIRIPTLGEGTDKIELPTGKDSDIQCTEENVSNTLETFVCTDMVEVEIKSSTVDNLEQVTIEANGEGSADSTSVHTEGVSCEVDYSDGVEPMEMKLCERVSTSPCGANPESPVIAGNVLDSEDRVSISGGAGDKAETEVVVDKLERQEADEPPIKRRKTSEQPRKIRKTHKRQKTLFLPLSEHHPWCPWVSPSGGQSGWQQVLHLLMPQLSPNKNARMPYRASMSSPEVLLDIRKLFNEWTSPAVSR